jgi:hypothetical protein
MKRTGNRNTHNVINSIIISTTILTAILGTSLYTIMFEAKNVYADNSWLYTTEHFRKEIPKLADKYE